MATEAQRLIGVSLTKIAKSRGRGGASLHKNLLVATVLQKARYVFMEEAYRMARENFVTSDETEYNKDTVESNQSSDSEIAQPDELYIPAVVPGSEEVDRLQYNSEEENNPFEFSDNLGTGVKRCCDETSPSSKRRCTSSDTCHSVGPCLCPIVNFDSNPAVSLTLTFVSAEAQETSELSLEPSYSSNLQLTCMTQRTILSV